jgi:hypothetical protein
MPERFKFRQESSVFGFVSPCSAKRIINFSLKLKACQNETERPRHKRDKVGILLLPGEEYGKNLGGLITVEEM